MEEQSPPLHYPSLTISLRLCDEPVYERFFLRSIETELTIHSENRFVCTCMYIDYITKKGRNAYLCVQKNIYIKKKYERVNDLRQTGSVSFYAGDRNGFFARCGRRLNFKFPHGGGRARVQGYRGAGIGQGDGGGGGSSIHLGAARTQQQVRDATQPPPPITRARARSVYDGGGDRVLLISPSALLLLRAYYVHTNVTVAAAKVTSFPRNRAPCPGYTQPYPSKSLLLVCSAIVYARLLFTTNARIRDRKKIDAETRLDDKTNKRDPVKSRKPPRSCSVPETRRRREIAEIRDDGRRDGFGSLPGRGGSQCFFGT